MPRKPTAPKDLRFELSTVNVGATVKTGATIKVGNSPTHCATLHPHHVIELARLLNVTLATDGKSAANWIEAVRTAEAERDVARKQRDDLITLQDVILEHLPADFQKNASRGTRIACWLGDLEGKLAVALSDLREARADHAAADVALQSTLKELAEAVKFRDAAVRVATTWEEAAGRNLDDLNATRADLTTLQANFDQLNDDFRAEKSARKAEATAFAAELHKRKALGWMWAGITLAGCLGAFFASIRFGLIGGSR